MDFIDILARAIGAFYLVAAIIVIRAMSFSEVLDHALDSIGGKPRPGKLLVRRWLLGAGAVLTGAGGAALAVMSAWAVPVFMANLLLQATWLAWARTAFAPEDDEDVQGRSQTRNAAVVYLGATVLVVWLWRRERMAAVDDPLTASVAFLCLVGLTGFILWSFRWAFGKASDDRSETVEDDDFDVDAYKVAIGAHDGRQPERLRFEVHPYRYPMVDADDGRVLGHYQFLPMELAEDIEEWHDEYVNFVIMRQPGASAVFPSEEVERSHRERARMLVNRLRDIYGAQNVADPVYLPLDTLDEDYPTLPE